VEHPATRFPETPEEFERAAEEIGYPVYLKPEISPLFSRAFQRKGFVARDRGELRDHVRRVVDSGLTVMLQEIVQGDATCMHGCAGYRRGSEAVWICYRRVREFPAGFGCGSLLESCRDFLHDTRLLEFLEALDYRGIFDAEFKLDPMRGIFRLIEVNARSWWQNLLPSRCGINVIQLAYLDAAGRGNDRLPAPDYTLGVKWIHLYNDFFAAREQGLGLGAWLRSLRGRRVFAFCAADDPLPATLQLTALTLGKLRKLVNV
jgi:predicted ATP-grasp superfamily ATP-dependent carboligase